MRNYLLFSHAIVTATVKNDDGVIVFMDTDYALGADDDDLDDSIQNLHDRITNELPPDTPIYFDDEKKGDIYLLMDKESVQIMMETADVLFYFYEFGLLADHFSFESPRPTWSHGH